MTSEATRIRNAKRALNASGSEDDVRYAVARLIESLEPRQGRPSVRQNYAVPGGGWADLYCPGFRFVVETKAPVRAADPHKPQARDGSESPFEQLERYVTALRDDELTMGDPGPEHHPLIEPGLDLKPRDWIGIVTDGRNWHGWRWRHDAGAGAVKLGGLRAEQNAPEVLVELLNGLLADGPFKRPPVPSDLAVHLKPWLDRLEEIHAEILEMNDNRDLRIHTDTKRNLWLDMLKGSGMAPQNEAGRIRLFARHSFLVTLARCVVAVLTHGPSARGGLDTDGFIGWIQQAPEGGAWLSGLLEFVALHDWRARRQDVLRAVYHAFVSAADRKVFGEFYTPDWLAELIVETVLDEEWCRHAVAQARRPAPKAVDGIGVLDPACGSGTFLYHAARRLLEALPSEQATSETVRADAVARLVNGIDIHPVAAEIARATLLRALPVPPSEGVAALNVYQGDALILSADSTAASLFDQAEYERLVRLSTPNGALDLPASFVSHPGFGPALADFVAAAARRDELPPHVVDAADETDREEMAAAFSSLVQIISDSGNSVWAWYIRNVTAPLRLAGRGIDRVVANPPWVKAAEVQVEDRKRAIESRAKQTGLWSAGPQAPHFDIAQLFPRVVQDVYAAEGCRGGWLVKKSALNAGNWDKFRNWHRNQFGDDLQSVDLEDMQPFGGGDATRSCLLFERCRLEGREEGALAMARTGKARPLHRARLADARPLFALEPAQPPILQSPSAFRTERGKPPFRQGATVVPAVLAVVETIEETDGDLRVRTKKSDKAQWARLARQEGLVPARWIRPLLRSDDMLPFLPSPLYHAIVPTEESDGRLLERPETENRFWQKLEDHYGNYRSIGKNTPKTLLDRIDYGSGLTAQLNADGGQSWRVVYPGSGDIMRAARLPPGNHPVIGHTLFWWDASTGAEAAYLVAVLNAPCLREAFLQARESGRHFQLHPWRKVPIARYDANNRDHVRLAGLTAEAERQASMEVKDLKEPPSNRRHSRRIRSSLKEAGILDRIDEIVRRLLPEQARP